MTTSEDAYRFEFTSIDGDRLALEDWRGRPVLVVNTASYCGYTPQYSDLQALWRRYRDRAMPPVRQLRCQKRFASLDPANSSTKQNVWNGRPSRAR